MKGRRKRTIRKEEDKVKKRGREIEEGRKIG
jgi:hypothetical protein